MNEFERAVSFTLSVEGGYVNDKNDPGKETKFGISKKSYPNLDIKNLTIEQAKEIYKRDYWDKAHCDDFMFPWNIIMFDSAVHHGVGRAKILIKEPVSMLIRTDTWQDFLLRRMTYMTECRKADIYMWGWARRIAKLYKFIDKELTIGKIST
jgi:lysozyme family protein